MRIVAGKLKGRKIKAPGGLGLRPTSDRVREAIFSVLGKRVQGTDVLDLFAGTGALGFEAISRGAREVVFVDQSKRAVKTILENAKSLKTESMCTVWQMEVSRAIRNLCAKKRHFDLVFLDPPYRKGLARKALHLIDEAGILKADGYVIVEHETEEQSLTNMGNLELRLRKKYGTTSVSFFKKAPGNSSVSNNGKQWFRDGHGDLM